MNNTKIQVKLVIIGLFFVGMITWADKGLGMETPLLFAVLGAMMAITGATWIWGVVDDDDEDDLT